MKWTFDYFLIIMGIVLGFVMFVIGIRRTFKEREARTFVDKLLIATSFTILTLSGCGGNEDNSTNLCYAPLKPKGVEKPIKQEVVEMSELESRVEEIVHSKAWRESRKTRQKLKLLLSERIKEYKIMKKEIEKIKNNKVNYAYAFKKQIKKLQNLPRELNNWYHKTDRIKDKQSKKLQDASAPYITNQEAINQANILSLSYADDIQNLARLLGDMYVTCYIPDPELVKQRELHRENIKIQNELLDKQVATGIITQETYSKVKKMIKEYPYFNTKNRLLMHRLTNIIDSPVELDISKISEALYDKINKLIWKLMYDDQLLYEQVCEQLKDLGRVTIPQLKNALKNNDIVVKTRVKNILKEIRDGAD